MEFRRRITVREMPVTGSVPVLACRTCKNVVIPAIIKRAARAARASGRQGCAFRPAGQEFSLCGGTRFKYCAEDREIVPGLEDRSGEARGYHVPVFFSDTVLRRYMRRSEYAIESAGSHKRVVFQDGTRLSYGINRHGRVFCWLGDLDKVPREEQERMREHNVESDHDVVSGMYKEMRLGMDLGGVAEERLKGAVYELAEASGAHAGFAIHRLGYAERHVAEMMRRPRAWHRDITQALVNLERVCVENIDAGALRGRLRRPDEETKGLKSLKMLEAWIELELHLEPKSTMMPFFVLNDWRNYRVHRDGDGSLLKALKAGRVHLGMEEDDDDDERMYGLLLGALTRSCLAMAAAIEAGRAALGQGAGERRGA